MTLVQNTGCIERGIKMDKQSKREQAAAAIAGLNREQLILLRERLLSLRQNQERAENPDRKDRP